MTTPQPAALPELPEPKWIALDTPGADADVTFFEDRTALLDFLDEPADMESLGRGEELFTADQMRAYALAALQSAQPAEVVSDEEISRLWSWSATAEAERTATTQQHAFAYALLALRPQAVPMTREEKLAAWKAATIELPSPENCYLRGLVDAEAHHRITQRADAAHQPAKEQ